MRPFILRSLELLVSIKEVLCQSNVEIFRMDLQNLIAPIR